MSMNIRNLCNGGDTLRAESPSIFLEKSIFLGRSKETLLAGYGGDGRDISITLHRPSVCVYT